MFSTYLVNIFALLFALLAVTVAIASAIALGILFKHAEKKSVATEVTLIYVSLFLFFILGAFSSAHIF